MNRTSLEILIGRGCLCYLKKPDEVDDKGKKIYKPSSMRPTHVYHKKYYPFFLNQID